MRGRDHAVGKDEAGSISDEEWERFLRDAEAGTSHAPKEPSARARMVARRLKEEGGRPEGWRIHRPPRRGGGKIWYTVAFVLAVGLLIVALAPGQVAGWFGGDGADDSPLAGESKGPGGPPAAEAGAQQPTVKEPFRGSPAARWDNGQAGIHLPSARALGWMSKAQVAQALTRSKDFLVASSLDPGVLYGERPRRAIALINPHQQDVQDYLKAAFRTPGRKNDPLRLFSRFEKSKVRLVGDVVKTRGRVTLRQGKGDAVEVATDVTYVYPAVRAEEGSDEVARTIVRREVVMSWDNPAKVITEQGTFSLASYKEHATNGGCDIDTGYFTPQFRADRTTGPDSNPRVDPYDRSTSIDARMDAGEGCGTATRS